MEATEKEKDDAVNCVLGALVSDYGEDEVNKVLTAWKPDEGLPVIVDVNNDDAPTDDCLKKFTGMKKVGMEPV